MEPERLEDGAAAAAAGEPNPIFHHTPAHGFKFTGDVHRDTETILDAAGFFPHLSDYSKTHSRQLSAARHIAESDKALETVPAYGWNTFRSVLAIHPFHATNIVRARSLDEKAEKTRSTVVYGLSHYDARIGVTAEEIASNHNKLETSIASILSMSSVLVVPLGMQSADISEGHACAIVYDATTNIIFAFDPNGETPGVFYTLFPFMVDVISAMITTAIGAHPEYADVRIPVQECASCLPNLRGTCVMWVSWFIHALGLAGGRVNFETLYYIQEVAEYLKGMEECDVRRFLRDLSTLSMMADPDNFMYLATDASLHTGIPCGYIANGLPILAISPEVRAELKSIARRDSRAVIWAVDSEGGWTYARFRRFVCDESGATKFRYDCTMSKSFVVDKHGFLYEGGKDKDWTRLEE